MLGSFRPSVIWLIGFYVVVISGSKSYKLTISDPQEDYEPDIASLTVETDRCDPCNLDCASGATTISVSFHQAHTPAFGSPFIYIYGHNPYSFFVTFEGLSYVVMQDALHDGHFETKVYDGTAVSPDEGITYSVTIPYSVIPIYEIDYIYAAVGGGDRSPDLYLDQLFGTWINFSVDDPEGDASGNPDIKTLELRTNGEAAIFSITFFDEFTPVWGDPYIYFTGGSTERYLLLFDEPGHFIIQQDTDVNGHYETYVVTGSSYSYGTTHSVLVSAGLIDLFSSDSLYAYTMTTTDLTDTIPLNFGSLYSISDPEEGESPDIATFAVRFSPVGTLFTLAFYTYEAGVPYIYAYGNTPHAYLFTPTSPTYTIRQDADNNGHFEATLFEGCTMSWYGAEDAIALEFFVPISVWDPTDVITSVWAFSIESQDSMDHITVTWGTPSSTTSEITHTSSEESSSSNEVTSNANSSSNEETSQEHTSHEETGTSTEDTPNDDKNCFLDPQDVEEGLDIKYLCIKEENSHTTVGISAYSDFQPVWGDPYIYLYGEGLHNYLIIFMDERTFALRRDSDMNGHFETEVYAGTYDKYKESNHAYILHIPSCYLSLHNVDKAWAYAMGSKDRTEDIIFDHQWTKVSLVDGSEGTEPDFKSLDVRYNGEVIVIDFTYYHNYTLTWGNPYIYLHGNLPYSYFLTFDGDVLHVRQDSEGDGHYEVAVFDGCFGTLVEFSHYQAIIPSNIIYAGHVSQIWAHNLDSQDGTSKLSLAWQGTEPQQSTDQQPKTTSAVSSDNTEDTDSPSVSASASSTSSSDEEESTEIEELSKAATTMVSLSLFVGAMFVF